MARGFPLLSLLCLILALEASAQPSLTSTSPANNATNVAKSASLNAIFSENMDAATASNFKIHRTQTQHSGGSYGGQNTSTLSFNPTNDFHPGELVRVTLTTGLENLSSQALSTPKSFSFNVAAGTGPGYFVDATSVLPIANQVATAVVAGDFNGDGHIDLAVANANSQNRIYFLVNGTYVASGAFGSGNDNTYTLEAADVDGDGDLDLIVGNYGGIDYVYYNNGSGAFASSSAIGAYGSQTIGIKAGDFDNDGDLDLIVVYDKQQGRIFTNNGSGAFTAGVAVGSASRLHKGVAVGDLDGDGDLDIVMVAAGNTVALGQNEVYLNTGSGTAFSATAFGTGTDSSSSVALGDVDNDGDLDVLVGTSSSGATLLYTNNGNGQLTLKHTFTGTTATRAVMLLDINGDGKLDAALASESGSDSVFVGDGTGGFGAARPFGATVKTVGLAHADVDGDGDLDIIAVYASNQYPNRVHFNEIGVQTLQHSAIPARAHEAIGKVTISVARVGSSTGEVSVDYATSNGTATAGVDYTAASGTLNWANGDGAAKTFTITIAEDNDVESDETILVTLSNASGATISSSTITVTILDNDTMPKVSFAQTNTDVSESVGNANIQVVLSAPYQQSVTIDYATGGGSATAGSDFTAVNSTLTFAPGETSKTFAVPIIDDAIPESSESVTLSISNPTNATLGTIVFSTLTILDDDSNGLLLSYDSSSVNVAEDGGNATITVKLSSAPIAEVTVDYATSDGTASAGSDYTATSGTLTFAIGETSKSFMVPITDDALDEDDETITVTLSNPSGAALPNPATATITITDDDATPSIGLTLATLAVAEDVGNAKLTVELSTASGRAVSVNFTTANGTATSGTDFTLTAGTLNFAIGETSKTIEIPIIDDSADEDAETFMLTISGAVGATLATSATTITITDNDAAPSIDFAAATKNGDEDATPLSINVVLSTASGKSVTVDFATSNGSAVAGVDYAAQSGTLTFAAGETSKAIAVVITDDDVFEGDEDFKIDLSAPTNATLGTITRATLTIVEDESEPTVAFTQAAWNVDESTASISLDVLLSGKSAATVTVDFATFAKSAFATSDFIATSGTLSFAPHETQKKITVTIVNDTIYEGSEDFDVVLSNPNHTSLGANHTATVTIADDEAQPTLSFATATPSANEAATIINIAITLSGAAQSAVTVEFSAAAGTASDGDDFDAVTAQTVTFPSGNTSANATFTLKDDALDEDDETILLTLANPTVAALGTANAVFTILDNDATPTIALATATLSKAENGGDVTATVVLSAASGRAVSVDFATSDGSAISPDDYTAKSGTLNFASGDTTKTVTITINDDALVEGTESFTLSISNAVNASLTAPMQTTIDILDDESPPELVFAQSGYDVAEDGGTLAVEVKLTKATNQVVTVDFASADGSANAPADYLAQSGTLAFQANETSKFITLTINDDTAVEAHETFTLTLSNPSNATLGAIAATTVTILEDDLPEINFAFAALMPDEGAGLVQVDITLSVMSFMNVTLDVASADGEATAGLDYTALMESLTFAPGEVTKSVFLSITEDGIDELDETLTLSLLNVVNATVGAQSSLTVTIIDNDVPVLSLVKMSEIVAESALSVSLDYELDIPAAQDVEADFASADFSAFAGQDYVAVSGRLTIPAGMTSGTLSIDIIDDVLIESDESFALMLSNPVNCTLGNALTNITITSDDLVPTVSLRPATLSVGEGSGLSMLTLELSEAFTSALSVRVTSQDVSASAGSDYLALDELVLFSAGEMLKTVIVTINDDGIFEMDETFIVSLGSPSGVLIDAQANSSEITILDDDQQQPPTPPSFIDLQVLDADNAYRAGETIEIEANLGVAGLSVEVDLSLLDTALGTNVSIPYFGSGRYRLTTSALNATTLIEGVNTPIPVTARDSAGQSIQAWLAITVDNTAPNAQFLFNAPINAVPAGNLEITLAFDEPVVSVPLISISGLGALSVDNIPMTSAVPSLSFRFILTVPSGAMGSGIVTVTPSQDLAGNVASVPVGAAITVTGGAPVLRADAGADIVINAPQTVLLDATGSIGATTYAWSQIAGPASLVPSPANSARPSVMLALAGDYLFRLDVTSSAGMASDVVLVSLLDGAPSVDAGSDLIVAPQDIVMVGPDRFVSSGLSAIVSDATNDPLFITWALISAPLSANVTIVSRNTAASDLQVYGSIIEAGVYEFEIRVQDPALLARRQFVTDRVRMIVVGAGTRPPTADAGADQIVQVGALVVLNGGRSSDPDAGGAPALTFQWSLLSAPAASTSTLQGTSNQNTAIVVDRGGLYQVGLVVRDADGLTSLLDTVDILAFDASNNLPRAGVWQSPAGDVLVGTQVSLSAALALKVNNFAGSLDFEEDAQSVTWTFLDGPTGLTIPNNQSATQNFTFNLPGVYRFRVETNDGTSDGIPLDYSIRVLPAGRAAPVAVAAIDASDDSDNDQHVLFVPGLGVDRDPQNTLVNLVATGSSVAAGQMARYRWQQISGPAVGLVGATTAAAAFLPSEAGVYHFQLRVSDDSTYDLADLKVAIDTHDALANPTGNALPRVTAPAALNVEPGAEVNLTGTGFDPNGANVTLRWVQVAGPPVFFATPSAGVLQFTPLHEGDFVFALYGDDGQHSGLGREVKVSARAGGGVIVPPPTGGGGGGGGGGGCALVGNAPYNFLLALLVVAFALVLRQKYAFRRNNS